MILTCTGTQPEHAVSYQLVLQNKDNTEKSISRGSLCSMLQQPCNDLLRCKPMMCLQSVLVSCTDVVVGNMI